MQNVTRSLVAIMLLMSTSFFASFGAADAIETPVETTIPEPPELVRVDGEPVDEADLETEAAESVLVWATRPSLVDDGHWTSIPLSARVIHSVSDPSDFLFYMWDGVTWAVCDNHPTYQWFGYPDGYKELRIVDPASLLTSMPEGVHATELSCAVAPSMTNTWVTWRITAQSTADVAPVGWYGQLGIMEV